MAIRIEKEVLKQLWDDKRREIMRQVHKPNYTGDMTEVLVYEDRIEFYKIDSSYREISAEMNPLFKFTIEHDSYISYLEIDGFFNGALNRFFSELDEDKWD